MGAEKELQQLTNVFCFALDKKVLSNYAFNCASSFKEKYHWKMK